VLCAGDQPSTCVVWGSCCQHKSMTCCQEVITMDCDTTLATHLFVMAPEVRHVQLQACCRGGQGLRDVAA
jgi:hypothetical protein